MRNFLVVLCTILFLLVMPGVGYANENPQDSPEEKPKRGLVGGILNQVNDTVDKTVKSTGNLVEETVKFTGNTGERTVGFTTETVNIVADPNQKKPVKAVVESTTNFVGETVEKTVPVVEQTTKTVQTVTNETVKVTKPLPKVPVVAPVVDITTETVDKATEQVKKTVDETAGTVADAVSKPLKKEPVKDTPPVAEGKPIEKPNLEPSKGQNLPKEPPSIEQVEQPSRPAVTEKPREEQFLAADKDKGDSLVSKETAADKDKELASSHSIQGAKPIGEQFAMERKPVLDDGQAEVPSTTRESMKTISNHAHPLKPSDRSSWISDFQLITGSSSISVTGISITSGMSAFGAVLADDWLMKAEIVRQKWYFEDILGALQWSHAPPGQPPQSTPFLYMI
ncbi:hypothetical protein [Sporosarcina sp. SAFN-010]|uniref:hypothetical protein n=1 Tax=Sporosarcina sp. SAFN-010 TaxID=3387273 RepID=UPI003F804D53